MGQDAFYQQIILYTALLRENPLTEWFYTSMTSKRPETHKICPKTIDPSPEG